MSLESVGRIAAGLVLALAVHGQYAPPKVIATVRVEGLTESSGIAASQRHPGVFWTHNDSGSGPHVFAFHRSGKALGRWRVAGAKAHDWEDIAIGPGPRAGVPYLYIGDVGDNNRKRKFVTVYRVAEPDPWAPAGKTGAAEAIRLEYPDGAHDAECLMVHPRTGDIYVVTKARGSDSATRVFKASGKGGRMLLAAEIKFPSESPLSLLVGRISGGDISPDGTRVILCDYFTGWEAVLPPKSRNFDEIWKTPWRQVDLGARAQGEAAGYRHDGKAVLATSEGESFDLIEAERPR